MGEVLQQRIAIIPDQQSGYDAIGGASPFALNVVIDRLGTVRRRPGIEASPRLADPIDPDDDSPEPVVGLYITSDSRLFATVGNLPGRLQVYELNQDATATELTTLRTGFTASARPVFAETERLLVIAQGRNLQALDLLENRFFVLQGPPPVGSHVIAHGQRLLANDSVLDKTKVQFSAPAQGTVSFAGHEQWGTQTTALGTSGFITAEARPDPVVAVAENSNEVWIFGTTSFQTFVPDASEIYVPVTTREHGCPAPYSIIRDDQAFAWIDDKRRIVHSDGRSINILSDPIKATLDAMTRIDDCFGYRVLQGPTDALVWTFPSDGRSFAYQREGGWSTWMGVGERFSVSALALVPGSNENLVGTYSGRVGVLRHGVTTDFGARIDAEVITGRVDRGTTNRKHCRGVQVSIRRGQAQSVEPFAELMYRDDEGPWSSPIRIGLGVSPDRNVVVRKRSLGVYRSRQWRFRWTGTEDIALGAVTEEFEILEN